MHRNKFGEPQPKGFAELIEALDENGMDPRGCDVTLDYQTPGDGMAFFDGWSAEVRGEGENDQGDAEEFAFSTAGYADKDELLKDLRAAKIPIEVKA